MSAITGRSSRPNGEGKLFALLYVRLDPEIKTRADRAADTLGISLARYISMLIEADDRVRSDRPPGAQLELSA